MLRFRRCAWDNRYIRNAGHDGHAALDFSLCIGHFCRIAALALPTPSQLSALPCRAVDLCVWHVDAASGAKLAHLSPHGLGHVARSRRLRHADPGVRTGRHRRCRQRSLLFPPCRGLDAKRRARAGDHLVGAHASGWVQPVDIIILGLILGTVNAFDMPARQALVHKLVAVEDLPNAVALNSSMINAARIIGPGVAGIVVAKLGEGACFLINAISYLAVIVALLAMKLPRQSESATRHLSLARSLTAGIRYTFATAPIRDVCYCFGVVGVMGMPYITPDARFCRGHP